jgi:DNA-binding NarL/FixJ family response regulator
MTEREAEAERVRTIRVLVADDHPVYRSGLAGVLAEGDDIEVIGQAENGEETLDLVSRLQPEVVLMDLHMPLLSGIEASRRLVTEAPDVRVLALTMYDDEESMLAALRAGARGYLVKGADGARILSAVRAVAAGELVFGADVAGGVLEALVDSRTVRSTGPFPSLTDREREVLDLIASGRSNHEIARLLVLSDKTVRNHISSIFSKLQVTDRSQAIVRAREAGLGGSARATP